MHRTSLILALLVLAFLGLADAWYLAQSALTGAALSCDISVLDGCNIVAQSPYSKLLGLPIALYGVGFYGVIFVLAASLFVHPLRAAYRALFYLGIFGVVASAYFLFLQLAIIQAACVYCLLSVAIVVGIALVTGLLRRHAPPYLVVVQ